MEARQALADAPSTQEMTPAQQRLRERLARGEAVTGSHHILAKALRFTGGGREQFVGYVKRAALNGDKDAAEWILVYMDLLPAQRDKVDLDDVCAACGVSPDMLMAVVVSTAMRSNQDVAEYYAAVMHPDIVQKTAESALRISGAHAKVAQRDREHMLGHARFITVPRTASVFVNANAKASAQAAAAAKVEPTVPSFSDSLQGAVSARREVQGELVGDDHD